MIDTALFNRRALLSVAAVAGAPAWWRQAVATAQSGMALRMAGPSGGLQTLDPALTRDLDSIFLARQVFRGLLRFDLDLNPVSDLGELVETSDDLTTFVFRVRDGAAFADGRAITAEDVRASYLRALSPSTAGGSAGALAAVTYLRDMVGAADVLAGASASLEGVWVEDERTLTISLEQPGATFLTRLASVPTAIVDVEQAAADPAGWWTSPNATGPFLVDAFSSDLMRLVPNPAYIGTVPSIQAVEILLGNSASQPINLFQASSVDVASVATAQTAVGLSDPASSIVAEITHTPLFATGYIALGNTEPPLDDEHIRRALQLIISPDLVARSTFNGTVTAATGLIPNGMLGRSWDSPAFTHDPDAAREEVARSGFESAENIPPIRIYAADIEPVETLRDLALAELGITVEAIALDWGSFLLGLAERRFPAYGLYWGADYPDPEAMLRMLFHTMGSDNYTGYGNPDFDAILDDAQSEADLDRRARLYADAQDTLLADAAVIPLYFDIGVTISRPGISGLAISPLGILGLESVTSES
jgi:oligopeptide transport system substrate-binding protein